MNIQDWLSQLLSHPAADPLDWESYCVTMSDATWKALWRDIDATQAYEDGLEAGLRLLQATQQHRVQLGPRGYQGHQILLYRSILSMLDKADRWGAYLAAWETIWAQTSECLPVRGRPDGRRSAACAVRTEGRWGVRRPAAPVRRAVSKDHRRAFSLPSTPPENADRAEAGARAGWEAVLEAPAPGTGRPDRRGDPVAARPDTGIRSER